MFETLKSKVPKLEQWQDYESNWIRPGTWVLIDQRVTFRKEGRLTMAEGRRLNRQVKAALKADRIERTWRMGEPLRGSLTSGNVKEVWRTLQGWYHKAEEKAPKPCYDTVEAQTEEREKLYAQVPPPGDKIPSYIERPPMNEKHPADKEVRRAVKRSQNGRSGGVSKMRAEDLKTWLKGIENEEQAREKGEEEYEGAGDSWRLLLKLVRHIWDTGEIPRQMLLTIVVLIPKGNSGDYRGIGLLEVVWKLIERVLDERMSEIDVHDSLHGF